MSKVTDTSKNLVTLLGVMAVVLETLAGSLMATAWGRGKTGDIGAENRAWLSSASY